MEKLKKLNEITRVVLVVLVITAAVGVIVTILINVAWGLAVWAALFGGFILQGLERIPADPPHKGVLTKLGKRQTKKKIEKEGKQEKEVDIAWVKDEGWRLFPFYPFLFGCIKVDVTKKNPDFPSQSVRSPDMGEVEIPPSITYTPDPENLIGYLNSGGEAGVNDIIEDIVHQKLREWAIASEEGPQTWVEVMKARDEAILLLAKAILGEELPKILKSPDKPDRAGAGMSSSVPTTFWFKHFFEGYFDREIEKDPEEDEEDYERRKRDWAKWKPVVEQELKEAGAFIEKQIKNRKAEIDSLRRGNGVKKIPHLGIILNRLNLGEFRPKGELAKAAELRAKEKRDRMAEQVELTHVQDRIKALKQEIGLSSEAALEVVQTERNKIVKTINESKWNVSPETRLMIEKVAPTLLLNLLGRKEGEKGEQQKK